jgi:hypothetical protein
MFCPAQLASVTLREQSLFWHYRKCSQNHFEQYGQSHDRRQQQQEKGLQHRDLLQYVTTEVLPILNVSDVRCECGGGDIAGVIDDSTSNHDDCGDEDSLASWQSSSSFYRTDV